MNPARLPAVLLAASILAGCLSPDLPPELREAERRTRAVREAVSARIAAMPPAADRTFALASPFSDHMVLQRDCPIPVWGTGEPGTEVEVRLCDEGDRGPTVSATVGENGRWIAVLRPHPAGGPFALRAARGPIALDGGALAVEDVLVGDVWLCGGQSNMEMNFNWGVKDGDKELADADLPQMRMLVVPNVTDIDPRDSFDAKWKVCDARAARNFSACGFFFGRNLHRELGVPVGLVETDWSGTVAETWLSIEGAAAVPGLEKAVADRRGVIAEWKDGGPEKFKVRHDAWSKSVDPLGESAAAADFVEGEGWADAPMPFSFEQSIAGDYDGVVWLRGRFEAAPAQAAASNAVLALGPIDDSDDTYLNGTRIGGTDGWQAVRRYTVPAGLLHEGTNTLAIRVEDFGGGGGFHGEDTDVPRFEFGGGAPALSLAGGDWRRFAGPSLRAHPEPRNPLAPGAFPNVPAACYNGMVAPLFPMAVRGAIWYQGCSNVGRHGQYRELLPAVIGEWRAGFTSAAADGAFPFYLVQLAAYMQTHAEPVDSNWAAMRWTQTLIGLSVPNSGTVAAIDVGDHGDIHPKDKRAVGDRLAALALAQAYGHEDRTLSPVPRFYKDDRSGDVLFNATCHWCGSGTTSVLLADPVSGAPARLRPGEVKGFEVSADGKTWRRTKASVSGKTPDCVSVDAHVLPDPLRGPVAIRYAWDDYPDCDLVSAAGLPVGPFKIPVTMAR